MTFNLFYQKTIQDEDIVCTCLKEQEKQEIALYWFNEPLK